MQTYDRKYSIDFILAQNLSKFFNNLSENAIFYSAKQLKRKQNQSQMRLVNVNEYFRKSSVLIFRNYLLQKIKQIKQQEEAMSDIFEFGPRGSIPQNDKLQHYRVEIRKLKELNIAQERAYLTKIQTLEKQLNHMKNKNQNSSGAYHPGSNLNNEIIKRDQQINRLIEENEKLKRQNKYNPDRELIMKKKQMFECVADKDAEITRLKKNLHDIEAKYNGKFFNEPKIKHEYNILAKENEKLRKDLEHYYDEQKDHHKAPKDVNNQILEGIKYKKEYDLASRENQLLRMQIKKFEEENNRLNQKRGGLQQGDEKLGINSEIQMLRKELRESQLRNVELSEEVRELKNKSEKSKSSRINFLKNRNEEQQNLNHPIEEEQEKKNQDETWMNTSGKKRPIFDRQSISDNKNQRFTDIPQPQDHNATNKISSISGRRSSQYDSFDLGGISNRKQFV